MDFISYKCGCNNFNVLKTQLNTFNKKRRVIVLGFGILLNGGTKKPKKKKRKEFGPFAILEKTHLQLN